MSISGYPDEDQEQRLSLPDTVEELIDYLDACWPEACLAPGETIEQASRRAGAREVVRHLRDLQQYEREDRPI